MNVKRAFYIILLFLILFSTVTMVSADDDDKSYSIDHAFIELTVGNDGLLHVDEKYNYSFNGEFNGVYRNIPLKSGESIENIRISADGAYPVLEESDTNGNKHLKIYLYADAAHTKKIKDCDVTIHITYDMVGVVTLFNDVGGLHYKLWGEQWDVSVEELTTVVNLPGDKDNQYYLNPQEYNKTSAINGTTITSESTSIPKGESYELVALMPIDDFNDAPYAKHVNKDGREMTLKNLEESINEHNFWNTAYLILGLLTILSPICAIIIYIRYGREPEVTYDRIYERDLPTNDPPEVVNAFVENKGYIGTPNIKGFEASIMNIIDKKAIKLNTHENIDNDLKELILTFNSKDGLSKSEQIIFDTLKHFSTDNTLNLSSFRKILSSETNAQWFIDKFNEWKKSVEDEIDKDRFFNDTGAILIKILAVVGIVFGTILIILGNITNLASGIYSLMGGIFLVIFSAILLPANDDVFGKWTEEGRLYTLKWENLKKFLKDNSLIKEHPPESIVIWKKYLIYGAALGIADNVYKSMKLQVPNMSEYDDGVFMYHYYGGYDMIYSAYNTGISTTSDSSDFGTGGGGSGGGGGGAF